VATPGRWPRGDRHGDDRPEDVGITGVARPGGHAARGGAIGTADDSAIDLTRHPARLSCKRESSREVTSWLLRSITPKRASRPSDASVDHTEARNAISKGYHHLESWREDVPDEGEAWAATWPAGTRSVKLTRERSRAGR
jgi:hypothetical protein